MTTCTNVLLVIFALATLLSIVHAEIFLSNTSTVPWTGACIETCSFSNPCSISSIEVHTTDGPCQVTFLEGVYTVPWFTWWVYDQDVTITISGQVTGLQLTIADAHNVRLMGRNGGLLNRASLTSMVNVSSATFQISNLTFWDSVVTHAGLVNTIEVSDCVFHREQTAVSIHHTGAMETSIFLSNVSLTTALGPEQVTTSFIRSLRNISVSAVNISGTIPRLVYLSNSDGYLQRVDISSSRLVVLFNLADAPNAFDLKIAQSEIISYGSNMSLTTCPFSNVLIEKSKLVGFYVNQNSGHRNFTVLDSQFFGCRLATTDLNPVQIIRSQYIMNVANSFFIFNAIPEQPTTRPLLADVEFWVEPSHRPFAPLSFTGQVILREGSSLKTNMIFVVAGSSLSVDFLTVTQFIGHRNSAPPPLITATTPGVAVWHFNSILIDHMIVDLSPLKELHYHATSTLEGITCSGNAPLIIAPERIFISWNNASVPIQADTWYPLGAPFDKVPKYMIPEASSAQNGLDIFTRFSNSSSSVSFQYDIAIPCAPPPVGFICVQGIWVMNGTTTPPQTVEIPENSGVVQVDGNLTVSGPIVFNGIGSTLNVTGCINTPSVEIQIKGKGDNLPSGPVTFIQQRGDGCDSLVDIPLNVFQDPKACKKVSVTKDTKDSTSSSLVVIFVVDSSRCSAKSWRWVVLGCVLGAVVLAAALSIVIWKSVSSKYAAASVKKKLGHFQ